MNKENKQGTPSSNAQGNESHRGLKRKEQRERLQLERPTQNELNSLRKVERCSGQWLQWLIRIVLRFYGQVRYDVDARRKKVGLVVDTCYHDMRTLHGYSRFDSSIMMG